MRSKKQKRLPGLMRLEGAVGPEAPPPQATQDQCARLLTMLSQVASGKNATLCFDTPFGVENVLRAITHLTPYAIQYEFTPHEITVFLLDEEEKELGWIALTSKSTGRGPRTVALMKLQHQIQQMRTQLREDGASIHAQ